MSMEPGWYPDPFSSAAILRWWDGTGWTSATQLPATPGQPLGRETVTRAAGFALAPWSRRFWAFLIDALILGAITAPLYVVVLWPAFRDFIDALPTDGSTEFPTAAFATFETKVLEASVPLSLISALISFVYLVPQNVRFGRTVGKRALGIRVRMLAEDTNPGWGPATIRWGVYTAGTLVGGIIFLLLDGLWPLYDKPWQQALHDKAAKTVVVPRQPPANQL